MEGRLGGSLPGPGGGAPPSARHGIRVWTILPLGTVTLLRCGFLVTSYPRFFRGTGRTGPGLEWQPRAGAEGVPRGTAPQARLARTASLGPVPSAAPMVLPQTWHRGETKVRGAFRPGRPYACCRALGLSPRHVLRERTRGTRRVKGASPAPPGRHLSGFLCLRCAGLAQRPAKRKQAQEADSVRVTAAPPPPSSPSRRSC